MLRSIVRGAQGRPLYTIGAVLDITERVRNERRRLAQYTVASLLAGSWTLDEASSAILQTIASIGDWVLSALWVYDETIGRLRCRGFWQTGEATFENVRHYLRVSAGAFKYRLICLLRMSFAKPL